MRNLRFLLELISAQPSKLRKMNELQDFSNGIGKKYDNLKINIIIIVRFIINFKLFFIVIIFK